jgi:hypothetical protein
MREEHHTDGLSQQQKPGTLGIGHGTHRQSLLGTSEATTMPGRVKLLSYIIIERPEVTSGMSLEGVSGRVCRRS